MKYSRQKEWMAIRCIFLSCLLFGLSSGVYSQSSPKKLTLSDAIELSLKNSHQLHASFSRVEQADARVGEAKNNMLPEASVSGSYLRVNQPDVKLITGKPSGGNDSSSFRIPSVHQAIYGIANVSIPIFAGGKIRYGIESSKYLQQAARLDAENDTQSVILNTVEAYTNLYKAYAVARVIQENLAQSRYRDSVLSRLEENGLLARNDRLKAQLQTSNIELTLLDAQNNGRIAMINMDLMLGLPDGTQLITDSTGFDLAKQPLTVSELEQVSLTNRRDLLAMQQRENAAQLAIKLSRADYFPTVGLSAGYVAASIPQFLRISNAVNIGVGVKYSLSSLWKARSKINEATAHYNELLENEAQLKDAIDLQVNRSFENFRLQQRKMVVIEQAVQQAKENARIVKNKFDNQLVNTTDLLDANVLLLQSEINLAVAKADLYMDYTKLLQTAGILQK